MRENSTSYLRLKVLALEDIHALPFFTPDKSVILSDHVLMYSLNVASDDFIKIFLFFCRKKNGAGKPANGYINEGGCFSFFRLNFEDKCYKMKDQKYTHACIKKRLNWIVLT